MLCMYACEAGAVQVVNNLVAPYCIQPCKATNIHMEIMWVTFVSKKQISSYIKVPNILVATVQQFSL